jgi:predicted nucleic acid-binding protein
VSVCLDAFALLAWLQNEPGADLTERFLNQATNEEDFQCFVSAINLGEVYYRLHRTRGVEEADTFWEEARRGILPLSVVEPTQRHILQAARLKASYPIAYADAFAAQLAQEKRLPLVSGDPELRALETDGLLTLIWLPR